MEICQIWINKRDVSLIKEQLKVIQRRFERYEKNEPHEEGIGEDAYLVDSSDLWTYRARVFEDMRKQLPT